jgi:hypothetical protein
MGRVGRQGLADDGARATLTPSKIVDNVDVHRYTCDVSKTRDEPWVFLPTDLYERLLAQLGSHIVVRNVVENLIVAELEKQNAPEGGLSVFNLYCACCGPCRRAFAWRGQIRCGCPKISSQANL